MKTNKPLASGQDHFKLICAGYIAKDLLHYKSLRKELKKEIFVPAKSTFGKRIKELLLRGNPYRFIGGVRFINLVSDSGRRKDMREMFDAYGVPAKRFNAIKNVSGWAGSTLSHRKVIETAKLYGMESVLVFEDDAVFIESPEKVRESLMSAFIDVSQLPSYDILYLGATLAANAPKVGDTLYQVGRSWGLYAYIMHSSAYDTFLKLVPTRASQISQKNKTVSDVLVFWKIQPKGRCFLVPVCSSRDNFSHNWGKDSSGLHRKIVDRYEKYLKNSNVPGVSFGSGFKVKDVNFYVINMPCELRRYMTFYERVGAFLPNLKHINPVPLTDPKLNEIVDSYGRAPSLEKKKETSIRLSFVKCFKDAIKNCYEHVVIYEDDALPCCTTWQGQVKNTLSLLPEDYGICFLGGYFMRLPGNGFKVKTDDLFELHKDRSYDVIGSHAVLYHRSVFREMISQLSALERNITETVLCRKIIPNYRAFAARPSIFRQNSQVISDHGTSLHGKMDFRSLEKISAMNLML